ncbi:MAG: hypothetical protein ACRBBM_18275 [Pseudomonadaceae bacterium]
MKIEVTRQACCSQDDQIGPLKMVIDVPEGAAIWELAKQIGEARFLQFTGTHDTIAVYSGQQLLFSIPAIGGAVVYEIDREDPFSIHVVLPKIDCVWPSGL